MCVFNCSNCQMGGAWSHISATKIWVLSCETQLFGLWTDTFFLDQQTNTLSRVKDVYLIYSTISTIYLCIFWQEVAFFQLQYLSLWVTGRVLRGIVKPPSSIFPTFFCSVRICHSLPLPLSLLRFKRLFPDLDSIWFVQWKQRQRRGQSTI